MFLPRLHSDTFTITRTTTECILSYTKSRPPKLNSIFDWHFNGGSHHPYTIFSSFIGRHAKAAVAIIVTFLLTSWIVSAMVSLKFNYSLKVSEPLESFGFLYEKPWTRLGPYVMGMFVRVGTLCMGPKKRFIFKF